MPLTKINTRSLSGALTSSQVPDQPAGSVLQTIQDWRTSKLQSTAGANGDAITCPASVTITPSSTSSKILIMFHGSWQFGNNNDVGFWLLRDGTPIGTGTGMAGGSENNKAFAVSCQFQYASYSPGAPISFNYLDSPSTTSAITYSVKGLGIQGAKTSANRSLPKGGASQNEEMSWGGTVNNTDSESSAGNMVMICQEIKG